MTNYAYLSTGQYDAAFCLGILSTGLSLSGSTLMLYLIFVRGNRKWKTRLYYRLLAALAVMDVILTIPIALQPFAAPEWTNLLFAVGNTATCEWTGFFFAFCLGGIWMNAALSVYYMLMVTYNKSEAFIQQWLEPGVYIGAIGLPTIFSTVGIVYDMFNPNLLLSACELASYPADCTVLDSVECIRGGSIALWTKFAHSCLYAILACTGMYCTMRVFWTVRTKTRTTLKYTTTNDSSPVANSPSNTNSPSPPSPSRQVQRIRAVRTQAMLYCGAFVNGFWVILLIEVFNLYYLQQLQSTQDTSADLSQEPWAFPVTLLAYLFWPLQGFFNCCIFMRPQILRIKKAHPERSLLWALHKIILAPKGGMETSPASATQALNSNPNLPLPSSTSIIIVNNNNTNHRRDSTTDELDRSIEDDGIHPRVPPTVDKPSPLGARQVVLLQGTVLEGGKPSNRSLFFFDSSPKDGQSAIRQQRRESRISMREQRKNSHHIAEADDENDDISLASCSVVDQNFEQEFSTEEDSR